MSQCHATVDNNEREVSMEPIVLLGLIVVVYGGYVALMDFVRDLSVCFPRQSARIAERSSCLGGNLKSPIKKMAGMHI